MTKLEEINAKLGTGWTSRLESLHFAFDGNGVRGAHFTTCSIKAVEGDEPLVRMGGPFSATQGDFEELCGESLTNALATIEAREATIAEQATTIVERDATIADLQSQLAAMTADRDQQAAALEAMTADRDAKAEAIAAKDAEIEALRNPPREPRILYPSEFLARFTLPELLGIFRAVSSDNEQVAGVAMQAVAQMFTVTRVELDNPLLIQLLDGLTATGLIAEGRKAELLADQE